VSSQLLSGHARDWPSLELRSKALTVAREIELTCGPLTARLWFECSCCAAWSRQTGNLEAAWKWSAAASSIYDAGRAQS
jgi:hypothetical protein